MRGKIMKPLSIFVTVLCFSLILIAQSTTPAGAPIPAAIQAAAPAAPAPNTGVHFSEETATFPLQGGGVATAITARFPLTGHFSAVASDFQIPALDAITVAGVEYRTNLAKLFGKSAAKSQVNLKKFHVYARLQLGSEAEASTGKHNFVSYIGGGVEYPLGVIAGAKAYGGINIGRIDLPYAGAHYILGSQNQVSPHVTFSW